MLPVPISVSTSALAPLLKWIRWKFTGLAAARKKSLCLASIASSPSLKGKGSLRNDVLLAFEMNHAPAAGFAQQAQTEESAPEPKDIPARFSDITKQSGVDFQYK